jgi:hypothetical protein
MKKTIRCSLSIAFLVLFSFVVNAKETEVAIPNQIARHPKNLLCKKEIISDKTIDFRELKSRIEKNKKQNTLSESNTDIHTEQPVLKSAATVLSKTLTVSAGGLYNAMTSSERTSITDLTINGTIDARDFKTMRDEMYYLSVLDISGVTIASYTGTGGTDTTGINKTYTANTIPSGAFWNPDTHNTRKMSSVILPSSLTAIGDYAFLGSDELTSFIIPPSVVEIGYWAFQHCYGLNSIEIPASVKKIKPYAFSFTGLTSVNIPPTVKTMGYYSFWANTELTSATIATQGISTYAFDSCTALASVNIKENVDTIGWGAFNGCTSLPSITIPSTLKSIQSFAFYNCTSLNSIKIPSNINTLSSYTFGLCEKLKSAAISSKTIGDGAFYNCKNLTSVILSDSLKEIGNYAFEGCVKLPVLIISRLVSSIGEGAFFNCSGLTSIEAQSKTPVSFSTADSVFYNVDKQKCTLYVYSCSKSSYKSATSWKDFKNIEDIVADLLPPTSKVEELPETVYVDSVSVKWEGDDPECSAIKYSVYVSENGSGYVKWLTTTNTQAWFVGEYGSKYEFYSIATDDDLNVEASKNIAEASVQITKPDFDIIISQKWDDVLVCHNLKNVFTSYQWYKNTEPISGETEQFYQEVGGLNGRYYVEVTTKDGITTTSNVIDTNNQSKSVKIYPNPMVSNTEFNVEIEINEKELKGGTLSVTNLNGLLVMKQSNLTQQMKLSGLSQGIYLVQVRLSNGESFNEKLIVK